MIFNKWYSCELVKSWTLARPSSNNPFTSVGMSPRMTSMHKPKPPRIAQRIRLFEGLWNLAFLYEMCLGCLNNLISVYQMSSHRHHILAKSEFPTGSIHAFYSLISIADALR
jgi:hypothetical protein